MKFGVVGNPEMVFEGQFLSPEQYMEKPGSTVFYAFQGKLLFMNCEDQRRWCAVHPSYSTTYTLLEATEDERTELWKAGYRMIGLDRPGAQRCRFCHKAISDGDTFFGPKMWHLCRHSCRHQEYIMCPSCWVNPEYEPKCRVCGREELYC